MGSARPVVVFFLEVLLATLLAYFLVVLNPEPLILEFLYSLLELYALELCTSCHLIGLLEITPILLDLIVLDGNLNL